MCCKVHFDRLTVKEHVTGKQHAVLLQMVTKCEPKAARGRLNYNADCTLDALGVSKKPPTF